jgi:COP9 signalosome complex subunit 3
VAKCLAAHADAFRADGNLGLAKQVAASVPARAVARLTSTYLTLSLADLAAAAGLASARDAEARVRAMVAAGAIFAVIDARAGMVAFREEPGQYDTAAVAAALQANVDAVMALSKRVQVLDEALLCEPAYVAKSVQAERTHAAVPDAAAAVAGGGAAAALAAAAARWGDPAAMAE